MAPKKYELRITKLRGNIRETEEIKKRHSDAWRSNASLLNESQGNLK